MFLSVCFLLVFRFTSNTIIPICVQIFSKMCLFCEIYKEKIKSNIIQIENGGKIYLYKVTCTFEGVGIT